MKHLLPYLTLICVGSANAQFTVIPTDGGERFAWGENIGWINFAPQSPDTPTTLSSQDQPYFGEHAASGFAWAENVGWINLGDGSPEAGNQYANTDANDFGINITIDPMDSDIKVLSGFAWAENIGWINFGPFDDLITANQHARIVLSEGRIRGYAWAENAGWINFDSDEPNQFVRLRCLADTNADGFVTATDFTAWIAAYSLSDSGQGSTSNLASCDQNRDGFCTPTDFSAWIGNFTAGCELNQ